MGHYVLFGIGILGTPTRAQINRMSSEELPGMLLSNQCRK